MKIVVTGSRGFIGKNLCLFLREDNYEVLEIHRDTPKSDALSYLSEADFVFHLAGVNRPESPIGFKQVNVEFTQFIVDVLKNANNGASLVLASSTQASDNNDYGQSKLLAEKIIESYYKNTGNGGYIFRLPNVFGKWCKPNYNSFVATFCDNIMRDKEIVINDRTAKVTLAYIDDVCASFMKLIEDKHESGFHYIQSQYDSTVGEVAKILTGFKDVRESLVTDKVGVGLNRALYATFLSYAHPKDFSYPIPLHADNRGVFCEMLKTRDSGQFSYFTALPGITRGGHYHHTKNEKFLVIKGEAEFKFENISTGERHQLSVNGDAPEIVETVPGWSHDITNIGDDELIVILWANEIFDRDRPDTFAKELF